MNRSILAAGFALLVLSAAIASSRAEEEVFVRSRYLMGTTVEIKARSGDGARAQAAINEAYDEIARIEAIMSHWRGDSDLARVNAGAGRTPVQVAPELLEVVRRAIGVSRVTGGAFDITVEAVGRLWRIEQEDPRVPAQEEIDAALARVGYRHVRLDEEAGTIYLDQPGVQIGLGGIAKGYAVDRAMEKLRARGIRSAMIAAGGDMALLGMDGEAPWRIGIKDPRRPWRIVGWFYASDTTVHTSGDYERFATVKGKRYHHILDPRRGYPASDSQAVTLLTPDGTLGDALCTGVFVLGPKEGLRLVESLPQVEALVIDEKGKIRMSGGMRERVHLSP
jgi:thiamine biosynthesis lipoprotein